METISTSTIGRTAVTGHNCKKGRLFRPHSGLLEFIYLFKSNIQGAATCPFPSCCVSATPGTAAGAVDFVLPLLLACVKKL